MSIKESLFSLGKRTGLMSAVAKSGWLQQRLLILCYHGIASDDEHEWDPSLFISPARFRERMRFLLESGCNILPLAEAVDRLYGGRLPPQSVAITFDDGFTDFLTQAVPVLVELRIPATLYLTTYYADHRLPVFDPGLSYVLWKGRESGVDVGQIVGSNERLPIRSDSQRMAAVGAVKSLADAAKLNGPDKHQLLLKIGAALAVDVSRITRDGMLQIMSPDQLRKLPRNLVDIQLHTHRHRTPRNELDFKREIEENREWIRMRLPEAGPLAHFCYPSGDYAFPFLGWLRDKGVDFATTCVPGLATRSSQPPLLPRLLDGMNTSTLMFEAWSSGFAGLLPRQTQYRIDPAKG